MKELFKELGLSGFTLKQKFMVWYFILSFCMLCISDDSKLWIVAIVVVNFINSARLIRKVPIPDLKEE